MKRKSRTSVSNLCAKSSPIRDMSSFGHDWPLSGSVCGTFAIPADLARLAALFAGRGRIAAFQSVAFRPQLAIDVLRLCQRLLEVRSDEPAADHRMIVHTPQWLFEDRENFLFAMSAAPTPHSTWKERLLPGDVDPAIARLHEELDLPRSPGLAEVMAGDERLTDVVRASPSGSGVVVLSAGAVGESVGLVTGDLDTLVRQAGADANVLVTSSSTPLDDALLVVHQFPDAVVLVVDARSLRRSDLVETTRVVRSIGGNVVSALCVHTATPTWREQLQHLRRSDV